MLKLFLYEIRTYNIKIIKIKITRIIIENEMILCITKRCVRDRENLGRLLIERILHSPRAISDFCPKLYVSHYRHLIVFV